MRLLLDHDVPVEDEDSVQRRLSLACAADVFSAGAAPGTGCWASSYTLHLSPGWVAQGGTLHLLSKGPKQALLAHVSVLCILAFSLHEQ